MIPDNQLVRGIQSKSVRKYKIAAISMTIILHTVSMILRKRNPKKKCQKNCQQIFFNDFFSIFLESPETHFDLFPRKIWVKLNSMSQICYVSETWIKNVVKQQNRKIVFAYVLKHCAYFGPKNQILPLLRGEGVCMSSIRNYDIGK